MIFVVYLGMDAERRYDFTESTDTVGTENITERPRLIKLLRDTATRCL
jgi:hypothetical protein